MQRTTILLLSLVTLPASLLLATAAGAQAGAQASAISALMAALIEEPQQSIVYLADANSEAAGANEPALRDYMPSSSAPSPSTPATNGPASASSSSANAQLGQPAAITKTSPGTVDSFFQIQRLPEKVVVNNAANSDTGSSKKEFSTKTFLWHVLDNIGVPMFGYKGQDVDPSIAKDSMMPVDDSTKNGRITDSQNSQSMQYKIPSSELDGIDLPAVRDVPNAPNP